MRPNKNYYFKYITKEKTDNKTIKFLVKYIIDKENIMRNYQLSSIEIPVGEELSKLIIYNYILNNNNLSKEEKIKLGLKYQLSIEGTSLFAQIELSGKIIAPMKNEELNEHNEENLNDDELDRLLRKLNSPESPNEERKVNQNSQIIPNPTPQSDERFDYPHNMEKDDLDKLLSDVSIPINNKSIKIKNIQSSLKIVKKLAKLKKSHHSPNKKNQEEDLEPQSFEPKDLGKNQIYPIGNSDLYYSGNPNYTSKNNIDMKIDLETEVDAMKVIYCQNCVEGFWDINEITKLVIDKYPNEFNLIKNFKNKNIDDNVAITILIHYFMETTHKTKSIMELKFILKKARIFIKNKTGEEYEYIIKETGIKSDEDNQLDQMLLELETDI